MKAFLNVLFPNIGVKVGTDQKTGQTFKNMDKNADLLLWHIHSYI